MRLPAASLVPHYLRLQAATIAAWWLVLWWLPAARAPFVVADWPTTTLLAFALPDAVVMVLGSAVAAHGLATKRAWAVPCLWLVAGATFYATLWCLGANLATGTGGLSTSLMLVCSAAMGWTLRVQR